MGKAILYVHDEKLLGSLKKRLNSGGFAQILAPDTPGTLYADAVDSRPEVAVVDFSAGEKDLSQALKKIWDKLGIPIIMLAENSDVEAVQKWGESLLSTILTKPVRENELMAALVLARAAARRVDKLKEEVATLKESIESRKIIEKAKGRLMERDRLTEAEAFRSMQRLAMDRRISMRQLAEAILLTDSIGSN